MYIDFTCSVPSSESEGVRLSGVGIIRSDCIVTAHLLLTINTDTVVFSLWSSRGQSISCLGLIDTCGLLLISDTATATSTFQAKHQPLVHNTMQYIESLPSASLVLPIKCRLRCKSWCNETKHRFLQQATKSPFIENTKPVYWIWKYNLWPGQSHKVIYFVRSNILCILIY